MADNQVIKFYRGNRPAQEALGNLDLNAIYFFEDKGEIYTNGRTYGMSEEQQALFNERLSTIEADASALELVVDSLVSVIGDVENYSKDSILGRLDVVEEKVGTNIDAIDQLTQDLAALDTYVGEIPSSYEETNVVSYIQKVAEETLLAAAGGSQESAASVKNQLDAHKIDEEAHKELFEDVAAQIQAVGTIAQGAQDELDAFKAAADVSETAIDTLKEIQDYITSDGAAAAEMTANISKAQKAADDAAAAAKTADDKAVAAQDTADAAATTAAQGVSDAAAAKQAADDAAAAAKTADDKAVTADEKAQAAQDAVDALEGVVDGKVAQGDFDDLAERVTTNEGAITTLQESSHTHNNKAILDNIKQGDVDAWNAAEQNAKDYADSLLVWNAIV